MTSRRVIRLAVGVLWLVDAALQAEPPNFAHSYPLGDLAQSVMGAPPWENHAVYGLIAPFVAHWPWWNLGAVLVQAAIGLALVSDRWVRSALTASVGWGAVVWLVGEGLGLLPTGFAMVAFGAPGPVVLYAALALLAWPGSDRSVDRRAWLGVWLAYWAGGALLQAPWVFPPGRVMAANFEESALGQPAWAEAIARSVAHAVAGDPGLWMAALAAMQLAIGVGGLCRGARLQGILVAAIAVSAAFWAVGQQFGGVLALGATDVGIGPLVVILALAAWPSGDGVRAPLRTVAPRNQLARSG